MCLCQPWSSLITIINSPMIQSLSQFYCFLLWIYLPIQLYNPYLHFVIIPSNKILSRWINFLPFLPFCMILDCNNLLVDCYFQNVIYLAFSRLSLGLLSAVTCSVSHCLHDCWDIHTSSLPRLQDLPSSLLSLTLMQVSSQRMLKHCPVSSDHPRYSLWQWRNTGSAQREDRMKNESPSQISTRAGSSDRSWGWFSSYFSDVVMAMREEDKFNFY